MSDTNRLRPPRVDGTTLKIVALVAMTLDHIGYFVLPQYGFLRTIGRLAFPIFAYMVGEGCLHTRDARRYFGRLLLFGVSAQVFAVIFAHSLYLNIMLTFSASVLVWSLVKRYRRLQTPGSALTLALVTTALLLVCEMVPLFLKEWDFQLDYGFFGILLPVGVALMPDKKTRLLITAVFLCLLSLRYGVSQFYALTALPLLALYNGERGKHRLKYLFYAYYPLHIGVLALVGDLFQ